ncbi:MAG: HNH endonuclease [Paraclostridium sp.]
MLSRKIVDILKECKKLGVYDKFYNTTEWRKTRKEALSRDKNECQRCKKLGRFTHGNHVHHVEEIKDNPLRCLDLTNLTTLCGECHNIIHDKSSLMTTLKPKDDFFVEERW